MYILDNVYIMYHNMYIIIICILDSVKTLLSRGTYYGEESNQLHHPGETNLLSSSSQRSSP
jgi:hypothetical protein